MKCEADKQVRVSAGGHHIELRGGAKLSINPLLIGGMGLDEINTGINPISPGGKPDIVER